MVKVTLMGNGNETDCFHKSVQQGVSPVSCSGIEERVTVQRMMLLGLVPLTELSATLSYAQFA
jgi:hypothetical protein